MSTITLHQAVERLKKADIVALPTETVFGLGGNAWSDTAVAAIYAAKNRPDFNPLIVHFAEIQTLKSEVEWNAHAEKLSLKFWPGPLSLVLKRKASSRISLLVSAGLDTVAVRIPSHETARALISACGFPLAAPSANKSGRISPTTAAHVESEFEGSIPVIEGEKCRVGLESTVVDVSSGTPVLLRPGAITLEGLESALGVSVLVAGSGAVINAPGMLKSHYAPSLPVRLHAKTVAANEALLAFGNNAPAGAAKTLNLSEQGDVVEAAANLFAFMRELDSARYKTIAVMPIPEHGVGIAINDRLRRAAADKN